MPQEGVPRSRQRSAWLRRPGANRQAAAADAARGELEINIHTIEDEGVIKKLDMLCTIPERTIMLWYNRDGMIVGQGLSAPPGSKDVTSYPFVYPAKLVPWAIALRVLSSKVMSARFIEKKVVVAYKNRVRAEIMKIKRTMSKEDRKMFAPFVDAVELYILTGLDDDVDGQKMLALKTSGKHLKVGVSAPLGGK